MKIRRSFSKHNIEQAYAKVHLKDKHEGICIYLVKSIYGGAASLRQLDNVYDSIDIEFIHEQLDIQTSLSAEYTWVTASHCTEVIDTNQQAIFALHKDSSL